MERELDVYFAHNLVGKLLQNEHGRVIFNYADTWLSDKKAFPLSQTLPLRPEPFAKECHAYFGGLLPEESKREITARILGISARNDFAMLERIGGECAGAITFLPPGEKPAAHENKYKEITESELAKILHDLPKRPLMAGENGIRLSLAGAQDKLAITLTDKILLPLDSSPSTHIIKPDHPRVPGLIYNEEFCLKLAQVLGIPTAPGEIRTANGIDYLTVSRYDRFTDEKGIHRLHQEDFCQALTIPSEMKYQSEGGVSLKQCFELVRRASSVPVLDIRTLLDAIIFNFLIGNNDAHGKNFSFLYKQTAHGVETRLAPLYDLICIAAYYPDFSDHMAMSIAKKYRAEDVYARHWEQFAADVGLAVPMVKKRVVEMAEKMIDTVKKIEDNRIDNVIAVITERCHETLERFR